ncbi:hypothetical protein RRG08_015967 [Elysia crispata]|uniref:Serine protease HTRA2, mitochondrial n=1 Tax=Elysia crispata TaxID=231223 RepID=A0AAE1DC23_9GAST|nr:hypothetical protein RRG08_015967 [Elysia crispata]
MRFIIARSKLFCSGLKQFRSSTDIKSRLNHFGRNDPGLRVYEVNDDCFGLNKPKQKTKWNRFSQKPSTLTEGLKIYNVYTYSSGKTSHRTEATPHQNRMKNGGTNQYKTRKLSKFLAAILGTCGLCFAIVKLWLNNMASVKAWGIPNWPHKRNFIADIVDKAGPAVVFIEVKGSHPTSGKRVTLANGSGFLVRPNGLIVTNAHVIANKTRVSIKLHDGSTYDGVVNVVDPVCDLAIVKIEVDKDLPIIPLGKCSNIRPGEFVAAMGSPLSLHKTVTIGIVSSPLRASKELGMEKDKMEYIQTDATIGLGNSGGPLVNLEGKAIGINTLKLTEGISFAIPSDYAIKLLIKADSMATKEGITKKPDYLTNGKETTKRRYMGITMLPLTPTILMELKDKLREFPEEITTGVYIHKVVVSSPAYNGGLHAGDVIIEINGKTIRNASDVYELVEKDETLQVTVIRGSHREKYSVETESV